MFDTMPRDWIYLFFDLKHILFSLEFLYCSFKCCCILTIANKFNTHGENHFKVIGNLDHDRCDLILYRTSSNALVSHIYVAMIPTVLYLFHFKYESIKVGCLVPSANNRENM
jgi:hypothetical protein